jgi:uncharacterized protein YqgC (DUF456 family)
MPILKKMIAVPLVIIGIIGLVLPVIPGMLLIAAGLFMWAGSDNSPKDPKI